MFKIRGLQVIVESRMNALKIKCRLKFFFLHNCKLYILCYVSLVCLDAHVPRRAESKPPQLRMTRKIQSCLSKFG